MQTRGVVLAVWCVLAFGCGAEPQVTLETGLARTAEWFVKSGFATSPVTATTSSGG